LLSQLGQLDFFSPGIPLGHLLMILSLEHILQYFVASLFFVCVEVLWFELRALHL
jgi:hypothetical protein